MKRALFLALAAGALLSMTPITLLAFPNGPFGRIALTESPKDAGPYLRAEILSFQSEAGQQTVGDFTIADLVALRDRFSIASQKDEYVQRISRVSYLVPGLGQLQTGDTAGGVGFLALNLAVVTGTLIGVYCCLPSDVRFDRLNYAGNSFSTICDAWNNHTIVDYLPALGVAGGGLLVDLLVRNWASRDAGKEATQKIDGGGVTFTPRIGVGFLGFNAAY